MGTGDREDHSHYMQVYLFCGEYTSVTVGQILYECLGGKSTFM